MGTYYPPHLVGDDCPGGHYVGDDYPGGHQEETRTGLTGIRDDTGKARWDLLPNEPLEALVQVYTLGAQKYAAWNWREGMKWSRVLSAMLRHLASWRRGNRFDVERFEHLAAVIWGAITLMEYERLQLGEDDRPSSIDVTPEYAAGLIDGEGSFSPLITKKQVKPQVVVAMTTKPPLERLVSRYGGKLYSRNRPGKTWKTCFAWYCPARSLPTLLTDILPHLVLKRRQAALTLKLWELQAQRGQKLRPGVREQKEQIAKEIQWCNQNSTIEEEPFP